MSTVLTNDDRITGDTYRLLYRLFYFYEFFLQCFCKRGSGVTKKPISTLNDSEKPEESKKAVLFL